MPRFKDQATCIRLIDFSESSQVVALLTEQHGKVRGLAKGSKRMSPSSIARFSGGIELLTGGHAVGVVKETSELATITEWDLQQPNWHLREDLKAQRLALYGADVVNAMLADHDPHPSVFAALNVYIERLADRAQHRGALLRFQWSVLDYCGYRPQLDHDMVLGGPLPDRAAYRFDPAGGGFTTQLKTASGGEWGVRRQTVQLLRAAAQGKSAESPR
ncbi:MAG: DNA repair protein RecO, partial [Pirellulaceae bacterium]|nr:DNA repair protein RecO [Pirellulaceae bacterium]